MSRNVKTVNVSFPPQLHAFLEAELESGGYASMSAVVQEAVRALRREKEERELKLATLRRELEIAEEDVTAGRLYDHDETWAWINERRAERARRRKKDAA